MPLAVDVSAAVYGAKASVSGRLGTKEFNVFGGANGSVFSANANVSTGIFTGEGQKYGVLLDANVGAYALKGEYSYGATLFGISMQTKIGGSLGAAHIGGTAGTYYDARSGTFNITVQENIGFGVGESGEVKIKIPVPFIKK